jgi:hypothetical protein
MSPSIGRAGLKTPRRESRLTLVLCAAPVLPGWLASACSPISASNRRDENRRSSKSASEPQRPKLHPRPDLNVLQNEKPPQIDGFRCTQTSIVVRETRFRPGAAGLLKTSLVPKVDDHPT